MDHSEKHAAISKEAFWTGIVIGAVFMLMFCTVFLYFNTPSINCPQEDSCHADYYNGAWHILVNQ